MVQLAGQSVQVEVLWPPETLDDEATSRLRRLVESYDTLADEAAENDDPRLIEALRAVRSRAADLGAESAFYDVPEHHSDADLESPEMRDHLEMDDSERGNSFDVRVRRLRQAVSRGANLLSLAFQTTEPAYAFLGDLDETLHSRIVPDLIDQDHEVLLSAHHGTHWNLAQIRSRYIVSCVGPPLEAKVRNEYSQMGTHVRTDQVGDIVIRLSDRSTDFMAYSERR
ncbi:MAG: hypothetical protein M3256_27430 [Actinomycetota bacterium]|nr:hypothetical protein [Actinomycetota bacterium]